MAHSPLLTAGRRSGGAGDLRRGNLTQILRYVRDHGPSSRHDIAEGCGLGISTMTDLVAELRGRGLVQELDALRRPGAGRPTRPIALDGERWCVLGVEVDLLVLRFLCTTVGGRELFSGEVPARLLGSGVEAGYELLRAALCSQLDRVPADSTLVAVQLGLPGYVAGHRGTVSWSNALGWSEMPLQQLVHDTVDDAGFTDVAVAVAHDAHLAGLHAVRQELGLPLPPVAVYVGGTRDAGGALIVDGAVFQGADGGAGDVGHLNVERDGPECACGRRGCLGSLVELERLLERAALVSPAEAADLVVSDPCAALALLLEAAAAGDARVLPLLNEAGRALGIALDDVIGALNPHVVVLGGYLGALDPYLGAALRAELTPRLAVDAFAGTTLVALDAVAPRVLAGAALAARDTCLDDPLSRTHPL